MKNNILVDSLITNSNGFGSFINTGLYVASDDLELIFEGEGQFIATHILHIALLQLIVAALQISVERYVLWQPV